jgi:hypothetical protein
VAGKNRSKHEYAPGMVMSPLPSNYMLGKLYLEPIAKDLVQTKTNDQARLGVLKFVLLAAKTGAFGNSSLEQEQRFFVFVIAHKDVNSVSGLLLKAKQKRAVKYAP